MNNVPKNFVQDHDLAQYSTYQIGGPADYFLDAKTTEEAVEGINWAQDNDLKIFIFGGGSNVLFDNKGFRGLVIRMCSGNYIVDGEKIIVDAGMRISDLVNIAKESGLTGLESWNGLPGTVGGAVYGNAGCFGVETRDILEEAIVFVPGEGAKKVNQEFFEYEYRNSKLKKGGIHAYVLQATFKLSKGDPEEIKKNMMEIARSRIQKQPAGASTGSFFKNPDEHPAGWLIDQCGLKGKQIGGAQISEAHANFFLNKGNATTKDILDLAKVAKDAVKEKFGIELHEEVVYVAP